MVTTCGNELAQEECDWEIDIGNYTVMSKYIIPFTVGKFLHLQVHNYIAHCGVYMTAFRTILSRDYQGVQQPWGAKILK